MKKLILGTLVACTGTLGFSQMRTVEFESSTKAAESKAQLTVDMGVTSRASSSSDYFCSWSCNF